MLTLTEIQTRIKQAVKEIDFMGDPVELYEPIAYTMSQGGKRMRPSLVLLACDMFGEDIDKALYPAIGIEIFHNFTLLHDDIMDDAPIRRGKPTVYKKWDANRAILSGDMMMILAYEYLSKTEQAVRIDVFNAFNKAAGEVCEGQQYDMNFEIASNVTINDYLKMIRLKTSVLLAASLQIGAIIANADKEDIIKIYKFGENIGMAFQLQDDLLDVFANEEKFGKKTGGDIVANKKTYLYLKAFEMAKGNMLDELKKYFFSENINNDLKIKAIKNIYIELDIEEYITKEIYYYYSEASGNLDNINIPEIRKKELRKLADKLLLRDY